MPKRRAPRLFDRSHVRLAVLEVTPPSVNHSGCVLGIDPGWASLQVGLLAQYITPTHVHIAREVSAVGERATTTLQRLTAGVLPPPRKVFTERAAFATPAGHDESLADQLDRAGFQPNAIGIRPRDRITTIRRAIDPQHTGMTLTVAPECTRVVLTLNGVRGAAPRTGPCRVYGPRDPHWLDAIGYTLCGALGWEDRR